MMCEITEGSDAKSMLVISSFETWMMTLFPKKCLKSKKYRLIREKEQEIEDELNIVDF